MDFSQIKLHIDAYKKHHQTEDAARFLIRSFGLEDSNLEGFLFREDFKPDYIALTTEGNFGEPQKMRIPPNIFDFDFNLVLNMIAHEMIHIRQKTREPFVEDKNEREWQAHYEMLFHKIFPQIPVMSDFYQKAFSEKALEYYRRMGAGSDLQKKYARQKIEVENLLNEVLIRRGEKKITPETTKEEPENPKN